MGYEIHRTSKILKQNKQNVSGNKHILVARCHALTPVIDERINVALSADMDESDAQDDSFDPLFRLKSAIKLVSMKLI